MRIVGMPCIDRRLVDVRHLDFPCRPADFRDKTAWRRHAAGLRWQMRLALGLWPEPPRTPLKARRFGLVRRQGYALEKVHFESLPGFRVTGNLYLPCPQPRRFPVLLVPHGHWKEGRLVNTRGAEGASMPGLCINVAQRGIAAFSYDMVGYNDSYQVGHTFGADDPFLMLWNITLMGLHTWNSIRSLDFVLSIPGVDARRVACTGGSGGGTQTFILTALDSRVKATAPAVMVSSIMQGGCLCENAPGLRVGTNNMEFAAIAAPRPQLLISTTGDWTSNTPSVEFPAIRRIYALYGRRVAQRVENVHVHAGHNYNRASREALYGWLGRVFFKRDDRAFAEEHTFDVEPESRLRVFPRSRAHGRIDAAGPNATHVVRQLKGLSDRWLHARRPRNRNDLRRFRDEVGPLFRQSVAAAVPEPRDLVVRESTWKRHPEFILRTIQVSRRSAEDLVRGVLIWPRVAKARMPLVMIVDVRGSFEDLDMATGEPGPFVRQLAATGRAVLTLDAFNVSPRVAKPRTTFKFHDCYNRPVVTDVVQDILTVLAYARARSGVSSVDLLGRGPAGPWCLLARALATGVRRTVVDAAGFATDSDAAYARSLAIPGIRRAGGLATAGALCSPAWLCIHNTGAAFSTSWIRSAYRAAGAPGRLQLVRCALDPSAVVRRLAER